MYLDPESDRKNEAGEKDPTQQLTQLIRAKWNQHHQKENNKEKKDEQNNATNTNN